MKKTFRKGSGYGGADLISGSRLIREDKLWIVEKTTKQYFAEDGLSFGVGEEDGYIYTYHCREATEAEIADFTQEENLREIHRSHVAKWTYLRDTAPKAKYDPIDKNLITRSKLRYQISDSEIVLDATAEKGWFLAYNGRDGDDWSYNNYGPYIVRQIDMPFCELAAICRECSKSWKQEHDRLSLRMSIARSLDY